MQGETYEQFVDKFKPKKTTDDCYTPPIIYEAVADWVANEYKVDRDNFIRPFYPGGDYRKADYTGKIVVDNPPFSILAEIKNFYTEQGVKFFLFAPLLHLFSAVNNGYTFLIVDADVTYENGARVSTAFVTNLEDEDVLIRIPCKLQKVLAEAETANRAGLSKGKHPKYSYPDNVITPTRLVKLSLGDDDLIIPRKQARFTRTLDSQRPQHKEIYGGGYLISDSKAAEVKAAEVKAAEVKLVKEVTMWELSEREKEIIRALA